MTDFITTNRSKTALTGADAIAAIRAAQDKAMPIELGLDKYFPHDIGATVYTRGIQRNSIIEKYEVLGYNIRKWGTDIALLPIAEPTGNIPLIVRLDRVFGTREEAERSAT